MKNNIKNQYDDLTVYYANELARKYCKFTLEEQKVLHLIFSQINLEWQLEWQPFLGLFFGRHLCLVFYGG